MFVTVKQHILERRTFLICWFTLRRHISKIITNFLPGYKLWPFTRENNFITWSLYGVIHPWLNTKAWMCVMDHVVFSLDPQGYTLHRFFLNVPCLISSSSLSCFQGQVSCPFAVSVLQCRRLVSGRPEFLFPAGWHFIITRGILNISVLRWGRDSTIIIGSSAKKKRVIAYVTQQQMHVYKIIYYYSPTCFDRFWDLHQGVIQEYKNIYIETIEQNVYITILFHKLI